MHGEGIDDDGEPGGSRRGGRRRQWIVDDSVEVALGQDPVVREPLRGYGNALRKGFDEARGRYIIMGDCDESYDFGDLGRFLVRLRSGAGLVMGNRLAGEIKPGYAVAASLGRQPGAEPVS